MSDPRDDARYWDVLAERIAATATREFRRNTFDWLALPTVSFVVATLLCMAVLVFGLLPVRLSTDVSFDGKLPRALAPSDGIGRAISLDNHPPAVSELLLGKQSGDSR